MQRTSCPEGLDLPSPQLPRNHSSFSDRTPSISGSSLLSPPSVAPSPAYIAASAASQIVNSNRVDLGQESAEEPRGDTAIDTAVFTPGSLSLVNTFLDQLLFSFLASSRSTSIASLRPAILEVLKPRLGKEVIDGADEELQGYLAGGDAEELLAFHSGQEFKGEYNLNLVWRRTRLRCMVYTRLGDMEEEDEDTYLEQEQEASANDGQARLTRDLGSVSPAAAIFLTSILEFIGEKVLIVAGEAACTRIKMQQSSDGDQRPVVEEVDVEKLAFNTTLGRLWRSWKKRVRSSSLLTPRPMSRDTLDHRANSLSPAESMNRKPSAVDEYGSGYFDPAQRPSVAKVLGNGHVSGPNTREVAENLPEEPDFSDFSMEPPSPEVSKSQRGRPRSMIDYRKAPSESPVQRPTQSQAPNGSNLSGIDGRPKQKRQRSSSVPAKQTPYVSPTDETFTTPSEGPDPFVRNGDRFDSEQAMPKLTDDSKNVPDLANGNHAVSTMYDGAINHDAEVLPESMAERNNRGISTYTESSNQTDEYDHEMAPQALKLHKPAENVAKQPRDSQASTYSSNYSFQAGEFTPVGHFDDPVNNPLEKGAEADNAANLGNGGPIGHVHADSDRQHTEHASGFSALPDNHFHTSNDGRGAAKRDVSVLQEASSDGEVKSIAEPVLCARAGMQDEGEIDTTAKSNHTVVGSSQGVPALSPLRELMNDAHDTSDEASSSAPSHDTSKCDAFVPTHRYRGSATGSISSSMFNQTPPLTTAGKVADLRPQPTANTGAEKAAVQRVSSRRSTTGRASASSIREGRPLTANSTTSQMSSKIKGMIGRESGDLVRQPMPKRNSSDNSESLVRTPNKEQDFEELIKSDETVKYTLTPQNMREMETPDSPRWQNHSRSGTAELAEFLRNSAPTIESKRPVTARSVAKLKGLNGLWSNPTNGNSPTSSTHVPSSSLGTMRSSSGPVPKSPGPRSPGTVARDPLMKDDSVRDFADFIRSTGPDPRSNALPNFVTSNPSKTSRPGSSSSPTVGAGKAAAKKITKQNPVLVPKKSEGQLPRRNVSKLQAREPTVGNNNATADLADFFRSGPVANQVNGTSSSHRPGAATQHTGSPNGLTNGKGKEVVNSGSSIASTPDSVAPSKMTQSSTNSRTGLLESTNRALPTSAPSARNNNQRSARNDDPPGPTRTQRRNRDPYSIDSDSETEDIRATTLEPPEKEEESLSDFLRNYNPPPTSTTTRSNPKITTTAPKPTKQPTPTIRERIARNIAVVPDYRPLPPKTPKKPSSKSPPQSIESIESERRQNSQKGFSPPSQNNIVRGTASRTNTANTTTTTAPQLPPLNPRATSPHLVSRNGTKFDSYRPTQPTYAKHVDRGPRRQLQAREEAGPAVGSGMSDLADFLRETEPPAKSGPVGGGGGGRKVSPVREKEREGGRFGRMFGRR